MAKKEAPVVRKTNVVHTNVTVAPVVTNVTAAWPTEKEVPTVGATNVFSQLVTNSPPPVRPAAKRSPNDKFSGGGRQAEPVNAAGKFDKRKVPGPTQPRWPQVTNSIAGGDSASPFGIRIALP